ncbi:hypothetical protein H0H93_015902 [Arthromyces matolae]|nr:hypothetical protein H0H93_015902 [Arthromyces matolae]
MAANSANLSLTVSNVIAFLTSPLDHTIITQSAFYKLKHHLQANLAAFYAPSWRIENPMHKSGDRRLSLSPAVLPPQPIYDACLSAGLQWCVWILALGNTAFDLYADPGCVSIRYHSSNPERNIVAGKYKTIWVDVPSPAFELFAPIPKSQPKTFAQKVLEDDIEEADDLFRMISLETRSQPTIHVHLPTSTRSFSPQSSNSEHSRSSSRSSNSSSTFLSDVSSSASLESSRPKQSRRERAKQARVFVDKTKIAVTPYDGGKTTVLTGGVMLGGARYAPPKPSAIPSNDQSDFPKNNEISLLTIVHHCLSLPIIPYCASMLSVLSLRRVPPLSRALATHAANLNRNPTRIWQKEEVQAIYDSPLLDLVFRAASSSRYKTATKASRLLDIEPVLEAARKAKANGSTRFCMGAAWRDLAGRKSGFERILEMVREVRGMGMEVCTTLGMLTADQARQLKEAGLTAYNHNLDTSREFYPTVITTRSYDERLDTISAVRDAGISVCSGGILGLGEDDKDRVGLIWEVSNMPEHPESFPVNALVPIPGTPLEKNDRVSYHTLLRTIATARIVLPQTIIRLAAGRNTLAESEQAMCFMAGANAVFTGEQMLTTPCSPWDEDKAMMNRLGLEGMQSFEQPSVAHKEGLSRVQVVAKDASGSDAI